MRKVIDGKAYDDTTAERIAVYCDGRVGDDFNAIVEKVYRTPKGAYFAVCRGYYAGYFGQYGDVGGGIGTKWFAISEGAARAWYELRQQDESCFDADMGYEEAFGEAEAA